MELSSALKNNKMYEDREINTNKLLFEMFAYVYNIFRRRYLYFEIHIDIKSNNINIRDRFLVVISNRLLHSENIT